MTTAQEKVSEYRDTPKRSTEGADLIAQIGKNHPTDYDAQRFLVDRLNHVEHLIPAELQALVIALFFVAKHNPQFLEHLKRAVEYTAGQQLGVAILVEAATAVLSEGEDFKTLVQYTNRRLIEHIEFRLRAITIVTKRIDAADRNLPKTNDSSVHISGEKTTRDEVLS